MVPDETESLSSLWIVKFRAWIGVGDELGLIVGDSDVLPPSKMVVGWKKYNSMSHLYDKLLKQIKIWSYLVKISVNTWCLPSHSQISLCGQWKRISWHMVQIQLFEIYIRFHTS